MRQSKFTEEQIIGFLRQVEAGLAVAEAHLDMHALNTFNPADISSRPSYAGLRESHRFTAQQ